MSEQYIDLGLLSATARQPCPYDKSVCVHDAPLDGADCHDCAAEYRKQFPIRPFKPVHYGNCLVLIPLDEDGLCRHGIHHDCACHECDVESSAMVADSNLRFIANSEESDK